MSDPNSPSPRVPAPRYATPADSYPLTRPRHTSHLRLLAILGISLAAVIGVVVLVAWLIRPSVTPVPCLHPGCGHVPTEPKPTIRPVPAPPLLPESSAGDPTFVPEDPRPQVDTLAQSEPRFIAPDKSWSVQYPADIGSMPADAHNVAFTATAKNGDESEVVLFGFPARNRSARDIVHSLIQRACPGATLGYEIPNAMVGYQSGYGEFADYSPQSSTASFSTGRAMVIVAIKHGVALGVFARGPKFIFRPPGEPTSHPSGANLVVADILGPYVNSFRWRGDPPR